MKKYKAKHKTRGKIWGSGINPKYIHASQLKFYAYLIPIAIVMLLPILYIVMTAFKPTGELFAYPPRFFVRHPTLDNFVNLFQVASDSSVPASRYLINSIVATAVVVLATLYLTAGTAFVLSKRNFRGKKTLLEINNMALMFVPIAVAIPRYFIIVLFGLKNSFWANVIPLLAMPVGIFLVKQFVDQLPNSLVEAAYIDGASNFKILFKIIIPLIRPALATVAILAFQSAWTATEASVQYIESNNLKTFAYYVSTLSNASGNAVAGAGISAAGSLLIFVPNLVLFIIMQSKVMDTMVHSGIK